MILEQHKVDNVDKVCLISAMTVSNMLPSRVPEGEISRVPVSELGEFYIVAGLSLAFIAMMHRQPIDDWDGVAWFERLSDAGEGSLADRLVEYLIDWSLKEEDVKQIVIGWLKDSDL